MQQSSLIEKPLLEFRIIVPDHAGGILFLSGPPYALVHVIKTVITMSVGGTKNKTCTLDIRTRAGLATSGDFLGQCKLTQITQ